MKHLCYNSIMDNIAYLNQISSKKKPTNSSLDILKKLKLPLIGLASLILIIIIISKIVSALDAQETDFTYRLQTRATNFTEAVDTYHTKIKSSELRAASTTLSSTLKNLTANLPRFYKKTPPDSMTTEEQQIILDINSTLEDAKINGTLDRTYARQLAYGTKIIILLIEQIEKGNNDASLGTLLNDTKNSLNAILPTFSDFSGY